MTKKMNDKTKRELLSVLPTLRCKGIVIVDRPDFSPTARCKGIVHNMPICPLPWDIFGEKK